MNDSCEYPISIAEVMFGNFIKYDRMYQLTNFAFYGDVESLGSVNVFIDAYSLVRSLYTRGSNIIVKDSFAIASCLINLAIHIRSYFETRHRVRSKIYIIYGGARPVNALKIYSQYNEKNMLMEDSNVLMKKLIMDNMDVVSILSPYLYDIFCISDTQNEFSVIASCIIKNKSDSDPSIIYSKDQMAYQLAAFHPRTVMYRPKKSLREDISWVVTKSNIYDTYRYNELKIAKKIDSSLSPFMFSLYQAFSGLRSRNIPSIKNANRSILILEDAVNRSLFTNGYNSNSILYLNSPALDDLFEGKLQEIRTRVAAIDIIYQEAIYESSPASRIIANSIINLYNPEEVRKINDIYFQSYPIDLNRL